MTSFHLGQLNGCIFSAVKTELLRQHLNVMRGSLAGEMSWLTVTPRLGLTSME